MVDRDCRGSGHRRARRLGYLALPAVAGRRTRTAFRHRGAWQWAIHYRGRLGRYRAVSRRTDRCICRHARRAKRLVGAHALTERWCGRCWEPKAHTRPSGRPTASPLRFSRKASCAASISPRLLPLPSAISLVPAEAARGRTTDAFCSRLWRVRSCKCRHPAARPPCSPSSIPPMATPRIIGRRCFPAETSCTWRKARSWIRAASMRHRSPIRTVAFGW